jgi:hypothetical protein
MATSRATPTISSSWTISPRYLKLRGLLDIVDADLCAVLHDS